MSGMAQFLDYDWDSDEDFEETSHQGRERLFIFTFKRKVFFEKGVPVFEIYDSEDFHFGLEKYYAKTKMQFVFVNW